MLTRVRERAQAAGIEVRGISDHGFIHSIYLRDPNGYVVELAARVPDDVSMDPHLNDARGVLQRWREAKQNA